MKGKRPIQTEKSPNKKNLSCVRVIEKYKLCLVCTEYTNY